MTLSAGWEDHDSSYVFFLPVVVVVVDDVMKTYVA